MSKNIECILPTWAEIATRSAISREKSERKGYGRNAVTTEYRAQKRTDGCSLFNHDINLSIVFCELCLVKKIGKIEKNNNNEKKMNEQTIIENSMEENS